MNIINVLIAVIGLGTKIMASSKQTEYVHFKDLDGMTCKAGNKILTMTSVDLIVCLTRCTLDTNCKIVFFRNSDRHCTGCDSYYTDASDLVPDSGTVYYVPLDGDPACNKPARHSRLCDGLGAGQASPSQGRIELFYNQTWWSVCDDCWLQGFCLGVARVHNLNTICGTFGLSGSVIYGQDFFGTNTKDFLLDNVACTKTEDNLLNCPNIRQPDAMDCVYGEAVGVACN